VIVPPFTPLQTDEEQRTIDCVLRRHERAATGLWHQVLSQQRPLLASPMRLEIELAGKTHIAQGNGVGFSERAADRVRGHAAWTAGPVQGQTEFDFDYDDSATSEGWRVQWEAIPPGQKSETCSLDDRQEGNRML
jgi:hypothetical protein